MFAGYTIVRQLGGGGMGEVYLAQHPRLPRQEALKVLRPDISTDETFRQRFIREAHSIAALEHPNIVTIFDSGNTNGRLWIATQYVDGADAAQLLRHSHPYGMPADEAAAITTAIAEALDYAHDEGLVHRDVKPANILLSKPGRLGVRRIYLADFGIARPLEDPAGKKLTATNFTLGTFAYSAPEQLMGQELDGRADQYALAATAFHLLTGTPPFPDSNMGVVISSHLTRPAPAPSTIRPELTPLDPAFARALAKNPRDRFPRCEDFAEAIAGAAVTGGIGFPSDADTQLAPRTPPRAPTPPPPPAPTPPPVGPTRGPTRLVKEPKKSESTPKRSVQPGGSARFWTHVGIDPIRVINQAWRLKDVYTLRCYYDDKPIFLGRNGRISVFGSKGALASYLTTPANHDLADLSTYEDIRTAATDGSLRVDVADYNVYALSGLVDDIADGPGAIDRDQLELAVEFVRDVGHYAQDDTVDGLLAGATALGGLIHYVLDPNKSREERSKPPLNRLAAVNWRKVEDFVESRLRPSQPPVPPRQLPRTPAAIPVSPQRARPPLGPTRLVSDPRPQLTAVQSLRPTGLVRADIVELVDAFRAALKAEQATLTGSRDVSGYQSKLTSLMGGFFRKHAEAVAASADPTELVDQTFTNLLKLASEYQSEFDSRPAQLLLNSWRARFAADTDMAAELDETHPRPAPDIDRSPAQRSK